MSKISKNDFSFIPFGKRYFNVVYTSPCSGAQWRYVISRNALRNILVDSPAIANLESLRLYIKRYGTKLN